ncbi:MAG: TrpB-like pyridoxal phosphate-dependent enzyme [Candidatus Hydrothermarchaeota archaeon]
MSVVTLSIDEMPRKWYNILPDLPRPLDPPKDPDEGPSRMANLPKIFPKALLQQEMSMDPYIDIPEEIVEIYYKIGRPTPLYRATRLEKFLNTPAKIYLKREDLSPTGSHKSNTAVAQAYYGMKEGAERLTTETGAGQWGSALSLGCALFDLECLVYMVRVSYEQKPYRRIVMQLYGAEVVPSPSERTEAGRKILAENPDHPGSLGIAISEAVETAINHDETFYSLGSVLNHVLLHQTVIGQELIKQFELLDETPDFMAGCVGGGSNFSGFMFPFIGKKLRGEYDETTFMAVEPKAVPTLTGEKISVSQYRYDHGDTATLTPLLKMYTLGHDFVPPPIHSGGLRYHGDAPILCLLVKEGLVKAKAYHQSEIFRAGQILAKTEGLVTAPETCHALAAVIDEAREAKKTGEKKILVYNHSGHGLLDLAGYDDFLSGRLKDYEPTK